MDVTGEHCTFHSSRCAEAPTRFQRVIRKFWIPAATSRRRPNRSGGGLGPWVKKQFTEFVDDPLDYALDKWIYLVFLGLAISILVAAVKGVFGEIMSAFR